MANIDATILVRAARPHAKEQFQLRVANIDVTILVRVARQNKNSFTRRTNSFTSLLHKSVRIRSRVHHPPTGLRAGLSGVIKGVSY